MSRTGSTRGRAPARSGGDEYPTRLRDALRGARAEGSPEVAVVVVNYGSSALLERNLDTGPATLPGVLVVVVDNLTDAAERAALATLAAARGWELVEADGNLGFGGGVNAGVLRAAERGARVFVTLNPDAVAAASVVEALAGTIRTDPRALAAPCVVTSDGRPAFRGSTVSLRTGRIRGGWIAADDDPEWKNWLTGACLAFGGELFAELGGFTDDYFLYWEDVDLSRRAAAAGAKLVLRDDLRVVHDEGGTHGPRPSTAKSPLYYFYNTRNRLLFGGRIAPREDRVRWLLATPRESLHIWLRGGRRQLFTQPAGAVAAVRGTVYGLSRLFR